jgi:hypothetical protein
VQFFVPPGCGGLTIFIMAQKQRPDVRQGALEKQE